MSRPKQGWHDRVQNVYSSLDDLVRHDDIYGVVCACGYTSAEDLWEENPMIGGSTDPAAFGLAEGSEELTLHTLESCTSPDDADLSEKERPRMVAHRILEDLGVPQVCEPPKVPRTVQVDVTVSFIGVVTVLLPESGIPRMALGHLAQKFAGAKILATCDNPDSWNAEERAVEELECMSTLGDWDVESAWDATTVDGVGGNWTVLEGTVRRASCDT